MKVFFYKNQHHYASEIELAVALLNSHIIWDHRRDKASLLGFCCWASLLMARLIIIVNGVKKLFGIGKVQNFRKIS